MIVKYVTGTVSVKELFTYNSTTMQDNGNWRLHLRRSAMSNSNSVYKNYTQQWQWELYKS